MRALTLLCLLIGTYGELAIATQGSNTHNEYIVVLQPRANLREHLQASSFSQAPFSIKQKFKLPGFQGYTLEFPDTVQASSHEMHLPDSEDIWLIEKNQYVQLSPRRSDLEPSPASVPCFFENKATELDVQTEANWNLARLSQHAANISRTNYYYPKSSGESVDVYVLDTGVLTSHPEFQRNGTSRATAPIDFTGEGIFDENGHGTHVSGIIAGNTYGVAKLANIIGVKVLDASGGGSYANIIQGVVWAAQKAKASGRKCVANMSIGGPMSKALNAAITSALDSGLLFVVAAGNYGTNACYTSPGSTAAAIVVSATDVNDALAPWSNHGPCVTLSAPGVNITSSFLNDGKMTLEGTSQASPHVAGAVALLFGEHPDLHPDVIKGRIVGMATKGVVMGIMDDTENAIVFTTAPSMGDAGDLLLSEEGSDCEEGDPERQGAADEPWISLWHAAPLGLALIVLISAMQGMTA